MTLNHETLLDLAEQAIVSIKLTLEGTEPDKTLLENLVILRTAWQDQAMEHRVTDEERMAIKTFDKALRPYVWGLVPINNLRIGIAATRPDPQSEWWLTDMVLTQESVPDLIRLALDLVNAYDSLKGYAVGLLTEEKSNGVPTP